MSSIAVNIICKNEEHCIKDCLESIKNLCDEIVITDTGSSDSTIEICRKYTDRIFHKEWTDDFSETRNFVKSKTESEWILLLDADEIIIPDDIIQIKKLTQTDTDAYIFTTKNFSNNSSAAKWRLNSNSDEIKFSRQSAGWFPSDKIRFFKNKKEYVFRYRIHELIEPSIRENNGNIQYSQIPIYHYGYLFMEQNISLKKQKLEMYDRLGELKLKEYADMKSVYELAKQKFHNQDLSKSENLFMRCISSNYRSSDCYSELSAIYVQKKNYEQALNFAEKSLELKNSNLSALNNLSVIYSFMNKKELAVETLLKIISIDPSHTNAYFNLAAIYEETGDTDSAIRYYKKTLEQNPNFLGALKNLVLIYIYKTKNFKSAAELIEKLKLTGPDFYKKYSEILNKKINLQKESKHIKLFEEALILYKNHNYKKTIILLRKSLNICPDYSESEILLKKCFQKLGDVSRLNLLNKTK
jgi:tetratricopeptide (TPR) repeat protein